MTGGYLIACATMPEHEEVEAWKQNPWSKLPTWGKWAVGVFGVSLLIVLVGVTAEDESQSEPAAAESSPAPASEPAERSTPAPPKPAPVKESEPEKDIEVPASLVADVILAGEGSLEEFCQGVEMLGPELAYDGFKGGFGEGKDGQPGPAQVFAEILSRCP